MRDFKSYNPIPVFIYFLTVILFVSFSADIITALISLCGALVFFLSAITDKKPLIFLFSLILIFAFINPLFSHNGITPLFYIGGLPYTLEAFLYGMFTGVCIVSSLMFFLVFSSVMTSDRLLYLFGAFSPKTALILSMAIRFIPLYAERRKKTENAQTAIGFCNDGSIAGSVKRGISIFSVMTTWALEDGIITADSMTARGYGTGKRTRYTPFSFCLCDTVLLILTLLLSALSITLRYLSGSGKASFYPVFSLPSLSPVLILSYFIYALLVFMPLINNLSEDIKWKFLKSKI